MVNVLSAIWFSRNVSELHDAFVDGHCLGNDTSFVRSSTTTANRYPHDMHSYVFLLSSTLTTPVFATVPVIVTRQFSISDRIDESGEAPCEPEENPGGPNSLACTCCFTVNPGSCSSCSNWFCTESSAVSNTSILSPALFTTRLATSGSHAPNSVSEHVTL